MHCACGELPLNSPRQWSTYCAIFPSSPSTSASLPLPLPITLNYSLALSLAPTPTPTPSLTPSASLPHTHYPCRHPALYPRRHLAPLSPPSRSLSPAAMPPPSAPIAPHRHCLFLLLRPALCPHSHALCAPTVVPPSAPTPMASAPLLAPHRYSTSCSRPSNLTIQCSGPRVTWVSRLSRMRKLHARSVAVCAKTRKVGPNSLVPSVLTEDNIGGQRNKSKARRRSTTNQHFAWRWCVRAPLPSVGAPRLYR